MHSTVRLFTHRVSRIILPLHAIDISGVVASLTVDTSGDAVVAAASEDSVRLSVVSVPEDVLSSDSVVVCCSVVGIGGHVPSIGSTHQRDTTQINSKGPMQSIQRIISAPKNLG